MCLHRPKCFPAALSAYVMTSSDRSIICFRRGERTRSLRYNPKMSSHLAARVPFSVFVNLKLVFIRRQMSDKVLVRRFSETAFYCCVEYVCGSFLHASHRAWSVRAGQWTHCCFVLFFSRPRSEGWPQRGRTFSIYPCPLSF